MEWAIMWQAGCGQIRLFKIVTMIAKAYKHIANEIGSP